MTSLAVAQSLAKAGLHAFPCGPDKRPLVKWRASSTDDPARLALLWRANALPAIDLAASGLIVIDCDRHGGPDGVAAFLGLIERYGLPAGVPVVETPSGGRHYVFTQPEGEPLGNATGELPKGIDVRGSGGYVIAPGAALPDGRAWRQIAGPDLAGAFICGMIPVLPAWLEGMLRPRPRPREERRPLPNPAPRAAVGMREEEYARAALEAECAKVAETAEGGRNQALNVAAFSAGTLIGAGWIGRDECEAALCEAALASGLDEDETMATIASGVVAGMSKPRAALGERPAPEWPPLNGRAFDPIAKRRADPEPALDPLAGVTFDGDAALAPERMLVKRLIPFEGIAFLGGQSGAGKTFIAIDLAVSLASGEPFFGHKVCEKVGVVIVAAEGGGTIANRVHVARNAKAHGEILPIAWLTAPPDLSNPRELPAFIAKLKAIGAKMRETHGMRLGAVVIDTLAASFGLKDENDNSEAARAIRQMHAISNALGVVVMPVHHYGKSEETGLRGASAWRAGADVVLSICADRNQITGKVTNRRLSLAKARSGEEGEIGGFDLQFVRIGIDEDGDEYGACYVTKASRDETGKAAAPKLPRAARVYLDAFQKALAEKGETARPPGPDSEEVRAVDREDVRAEFYRAWRADGDTEQKRLTAKRKAFNRAEDELVEGGEIFAREIAGRALVWAGGERQDD